MYLEKVLQSSLQHLDRKKNDFGNKWRAFYEAKFKTNLATQAHVQGTWYKSGGPKREYNNIETYKVVLTSDANKECESNDNSQEKSIDPPVNDDEKLNEQTTSKNEIEYMERKMKTTKQSKCNGHCCSPNNKNSALKLENNKDELGNDSVD